MNFLQISSYIGEFILFLNLLIYFKSYRKKPIAFKLFCTYLLLAFIIEVIITFYFEKGENNIHISHYYFIGQFILLSLFFKHILKKSIQKKIINIILTIVLIALGIYYSMHPSNYYKFNIFEIALTSIPLIIYCFFFFIQKIEGSDKRFIYIVSGFFLYILCSTLLFTTGNITAGIKRIIWISNAMLYIVYQVLIFVEWYKNFRKKETPFISTKHSITNK